VQEPKRQGVGALERLQVGLVRNTHAGLPRGCSDCFRDCPRRCLGERASAAHVDACLPRVARLEGLEDDQTTLLTECGMNRVLIRSTLTPGTISLTASCSRLTSDTVSVTSNPAPVVDGLY
jgi:hypothetical protein